MSPTPQFARPLATCTWRWVACRHNPTHVHDFCGSHQIHNWFGVVLNFSIQHYADMRASNHVLPTGILLRMPICNSKMASYCLQLGDISGLIFSKSIKYICVTWTCLSWQYSGKHAVNSDQQLHAHLTLSCAFCCAGCCECISILDAREGHPVSECSISSLRC